MERQDELERAETKRYAQALIKRRYPTKYIMQETGLSKTTIYKYRDELRIKEEDVVLWREKLKACESETFSEEKWNRYTDIIRQAYRDGRIRKPIRLVPECRAGSAH